MTVHLSTETEIDQPAIAVWEVVADYDRDPQWRHGVTTMAPSPPGPVMPGTTTLEEMRFAGRTLRNHGEVVAVEPGRSFSWRTTRGASARGSRTVEPLGAGRCRVRLELHVDPKPPERLLLPVLRRMLQRQVDADGGRLRRLVEAPTEAALQPV